MGRPVEVFEYTRWEPKKPSVKISVGRGEFHQWGVDYEEFESGPGMYSTAIVEMPDGTIKTPAADMMQ